MKKYLIGHSKNGVLHHTILQNVFPSESSNLSKEGLLEEFMASSQFFIEEVVGEKIHPLDVMVGDTINYSPVTKDSFVVKSIEKTHAEGKYHKTGYVTFDVVDMGYMTSYFEGDKVHFPLYLIKRI